MSSTTLAGGGRIWLEREEGGREEGCLAVAGVPFVNEDGGGGGDEVVFDKGEDVLGSEVRGVAAVSDVGLRGVAPSAEEDEGRNNTLRAVPGGCNDIDCLFVGEPIRCDLGVVVAGFGDARELALGLGLVGLTARDEEDAADRRDDVRFRPVLPVLA